MHAFSHFPQLLAPGRHVEHTHTGCRDGKDPNLIVRECEMHSWTWETTRSWPNSRDTIWGVSRRSKVRGERRPHSLQYARSPRAARALRQQAPDPPHGSRHLPPRVHPSAHGLARSDLLDPHARLVPAKSKRQSKARGNKCTFSIELDAQRYMHDASRQALAPCCSLINSSVLDIL